jgi:hypothetical protein
VHLLRISIVVSTEWRGYRSDICCVYLLRRKASPTGLSTIIIAAGIWRSTASRDALSI